jgi:hypothetical protein
MRDLTGGFYICVTRLSAAGLPIILEGQIIWRSNRKSSSFLNKNILTSDDGHIGRNMFGILIF